MILARGFAALQQNIYIGPIFLINRGLYVPMLRFISILS